MRFGKKPADGNGFFFYTMKDLPHGVQQKTNVELEEHTVSFTDLRSFNSPFTLLRNGFAVETLQRTSDMQWTDASQVVTIAEHRHGPNSIPFLALLSRADVTSQLYHDQLTVCIIIIS